MPITYNSEKINVALKLNNGTTETGAVKTVSQSVTGGQKIDPSIYQSDLEGGRSSAIAIATALAVVMTKSVYEIQETLTGEISA